VGGVGDERALAAERVLEAGQQRVDRVAEVLEVVDGAVERKPPVEAGGRDLPGGLGDRA
jgi:hypothetical protein